MDSPCDDDAGTSVCRPALWCRGVPAGVGEWIRDLGPTEKNQPQRTLGGTEERRLWILGTVGANLLPDPCLGLVSFANRNNDFAIEPGDFITSL